MNDYSPSQKVCAQLFTTDQNLYCLSLLRRNNGENPEELLICWDFIKKCESISSKNLIAIMLQNFSFKLIPSLCMTASGEITTEFPIFFFLSFREVKSITHQLACQVSGYTNNWLCTWNALLMFVLFFREENAQEIVHKIEWRITARKLVFVSALEAAFP